MKEDISSLGDYDAPFCEQQYTHGSCYISLFKFKSFDQLIPPKLPLLDIYSVVALIGVGKPLSLINVPQRKLRGFQLRVLGIVQHGKLRVQKPVI